MSLLLDALNKTSGQTKPADQQAPDCVDDQPAEAANASLGPSTTSNRELTLEVQDHTRSSEQNGEAAAEIEVEFDIDEAEFTALLDDPDDLKQEIQHAAAEATFEADAGLAIDRIDELSAEISELPAIPPLAGAVDQAEQANSAELNRTEASLDQDNLDKAANTLAAEAEQESAQPEPVLELPVEDRNGHLLIDSQAEPESLAQEVLQDAPLVHAYSQAQKKRRQIMLLITVTILLVATAVIYKLLIEEKTTAANANSFDPVVPLTEGTVRNSVVLEEVDPASIPERLSLPEFSSATDIAENMVLIEPVRAASEDLRRAYTALNQGKLEQAERLYRKLSTNEVNKVAALSGLSSVAIAKNDFENARVNLQHILSIDRHNSWAAATLAALPYEASELNPDNSGSLSQLKSLRNADPDNHQIAYMLGNKFAATGIWTEAQAAYFDAFSMDSQNANYAFNLAIALDHLGKTKQAKDFYQQALQLAESRGADFDIASLRKRLQRGGK